MFKICVQAKNSMVHSKFIATTGDTNIIESPVDNEILT